MPGPILLDGRRLAERLLPDQIARARRVLDARGRAARAHIVGFGEPGEPPVFIRRKIAACARAGVEASAHVLDARAATTADVLEAMRATPAEADGLFLEFPYPPGVDGEVVAAAIPPALDVDVMTEARIARFRAGDGLPPVTVSAVLALLDADDVSIDGLGGVVVAERSSFSAMLAEALARRGARVGLVPPSRADAARAAQLVVVAAERPGLLKSEEIQPGAVVIDVGYYNPGGTGDVDTRGGIEHLGAIARVPGGVGPATVAMLVDRVITLAESAA